MPLVTAFNLRREDRLDELEQAVREALSSKPDLQINDGEVMLVPVVKAEGFHGTVTRLAACVAEAFKAVAGRERKVIVVIRPYDVGAAGWVSA